MSALLLVLSDNVTGMVLANHALDKRPVNHKDRTFSVGSEPRQSGHESAACIDAGNRPLQVCRTFNTLPLNTNQQIVATTFSALDNVPSIQSTRASFELGCQFTTQLQRTHGTTRVGSD